MALSGIVRAIPLLSTNADVLALVVVMLAMYALCCWNARSAVNGLVLSVGYAPPSRFESVKSTVVEEILESA